MLSPKEPRKISPNNLITWGKLANFVERGRPRQPSRLLPHVYSSPAVVQQQLCPYPADTYECSTIAVSWECASTCYSYLFAVYFYHWGFFKLTYILEREIFSCEESG